MHQVNIHRRSFLKRTSLAGGGLMLSFLLPDFAIAKNEENDCEFFQPNAYLKIDKKGLVTLFVPKQEMGQGVNTSLPMIVAEELDADWKNVKIEIAPHGTLKPGESSTGGSNAVRGMWQPLRKAGATAKAMLIGAAAKMWDVKPEQCAADKGIVMNMVNMQTITYGELVCDAAKMPIPENVTLKKIDEFKIIGKAEKKSNLKEIITGKAKYGIDVQLPGMVYAVVERCPVLKGTVISVDDSEAKKVNGFIKIVMVASSGKPTHVKAGVAVIATNVWSAMKARKLLKIKWDEGADNKESTIQLFKTFAAKAKEKPILEVFKKGEIATALPANTLIAEYGAPLLAHTTMEPISFVAQVKDNNCEIWGGMQVPDSTVNLIATECNLKRENIKVNLTIMGGGFGRRLHSDFAVEAVKIAKQVDAPVKIIWDRTDDIRNDTYRPANYHRLQATWNEKNQIQSWQHHLLTTSVSLMTNGPDTKNPSENSGGISGDFWYDVPNILMSYSPVNINLNRGWLRGVEYVVNVFPVECFIDEVAHKLKQDPLQYRLSLLETRASFEFGSRGQKQEPARVAAVLKLAAEKISYTSPRKKNHFIGLATHAYIGIRSFAAHAIEIEMLGPKKFHIHKIVTAVDCGIVVNPDGMKNQMEGGLAFALTQALKGEITIVDSKVVQKGFMDYELLHFDEMPVIEVHSITSTESPGGIGEVGLPTVAPALCNALAAAGHRPRTLPIKNEGFTWV